MSSRTNLIGRIMMSVTTLRNSTSSVTSILRKSLTKQKKKNIAVRFQRRVSRYQHSAVTTWKPSDLMRRMWMMTQWRDSQINLARTIVSSSFGLPWRLSQKKALISRGKRVRRTKKVNLSFYLVGARWRDLPALLCLTKILIMKKYMRN